MLWFCAFCSASSGCLTILFWDVSDTLRNELRSLVASDPSLVYYCPIIFNTYLNGMVTRLNFYGIVYFCSIFININIYRVNTFLIRYFARSFNGIRLNVLLYISSLVLSYTTTVIFLFSPESFIILICNPGFGVDGT